MVTTFRKSLGLTTVAWLLLVVFVAFVVNFNALARAALAVEESFRMYVAPSAERAYAYGNRHFDARHPLLYDIVRAERFYNRAVVLDSHLPYLQHQLARIAFLRNGNVDAMARINLELANNPEPSPSSYYVRGLIEGHMGHYDEAAKDYEKYLESDPNNWAAITDYSWVLLKAGRSADAATATERGLEYFPDNAWLLNASAIAHYEMGDLAKAYERAKAAVAASESVTEQRWLSAYPGNDPKIAMYGIQTLRNASLANMHMIALALASSTVQSM